MSGPTIVVPAGNVREGDYLLSFLHCKSETPSATPVTRTSWNGHSRVERKITSGFREYVIHKDTLVLIHRESFEGK